MITVSNIMWGNENNSFYFKLLEKLGCYGIELAPNLMWKEPVEVSDHEVNELRKQINESNLRIISFHALLFTRPDLKLFEDVSSRDRLFDYLVNLARLARKLDCPLMVLGSPRNRARGNLTVSEADRIAISFFQRVADRIAGSDVVLCIEPLSKNETDYISSYVDGVRLVKKVNHPNFQLMLDAKSLIIDDVNVKDAVYQSRKYLKHFHVNDPGNSPPGSSGYDHKVFGENLKSIGYSGAISLEVGRNYGMYEDVIRQSVAYVKNKYQGVIEHV